MAEIKIENKIAFNVHHHATFHHKVVEMLTSTEALQLPFISRAVRRKVPVLTESKRASLPREVAGSVSFKGIRVVFLPPHDITTKVGWLVCNGTISTDGPYYATVV